MGRDRTALMARATGCQPPLEQQGVTILHHVRTLPSRAIRFVLKNPPEKMKQAQTSPRLVRRGNSLDNEGKKMKKLLLATTALTLSAGVAAADVALSGDARMGLTHVNTLAANKTAFTSRARVTFTLSGETDSGMAFGGSFRADNAAGAASGTGGSVFISGEFGRLTMGDTAGAAQFVIGHVDSISLSGHTGLDLNEVLYLGNNTAQGNVRPTARYDYTIEGFTVAVSHTNTGAAPKAAAIALGYAFDGFKVGIGYETQNATGAIAAVAPDLTATPISLGAAAVPARGKLNHVVVGAQASFEGITAKAIAGRASGAGSTGFVSRNQYALSVSGSFDAVTVTAFGRQEFTKNRHLGLGASYDLGGGAKIVGGVVNTNFNAANTKSRTIADMGLTFSF